MYCIPLENKIQNFKIKGGFLAALVCVIPFLNSCSSDEVMASVNDHELLREDGNTLMKELGYDPSNEKDKMLFVDSWINGKIMGDELRERNEPKSKIAHYRSEIFEGELAFYFLTEIELMKTVDTTISEKELKSYFANHLEEFSLQDFIVKALFVKLPIDAPKIDEIKEAYLLKNDKDIARIESYAKLYAEDFYFDDENWVLFQDLRGKIQLKSINKENLVLNRTKTFFSDKTHIYFLNILDYKLKNDHPPFEFVKEQIKERLLAQRLNDRRNEVENTLKEKLKKKHDVQINF